MARNAETQKFAIQSKILIDYVPGSRVDDVVTVVSRLRFETKQTKHQHAIGTQTHTSKTVFIVSDSLLLQYTIVP